MKYPLRVLAISAAATALLAGPGTAAPALAAARTTPPAVLHVGQIGRQDVAARGGCEPDTLAEPDVAVSPFNSKIQVAVAHDCRFATGGAVDISYAWTHDGGADWHHAPMPGLTKAVGGVWDRASDPVVAFGADGSVYVSALVFDTGCPGGVTVSRSADGGVTFGPPVLVQKSTACTVLNDKPWLVADTQPNSPFSGRIYQFWTELLSTSSGRVLGVPQVVRWSDDQGRHWSATHLVTPRDENTENSQPVVEPDGAVVITYLFAGTLQGRAVGQRAIFREQGATVPPAARNGMRLVARTSADGGATWSARTLIAPNIGVGPAGIRCCLPMVAVNPATGHLYAVWNANGPGVLDPVELSSSADGRHWSHPVQVTPGHSPHIQYVNAAVAASSGRVYVSFGARNIAVAGGNIVQQELTWSANGGATFTRPIALGPPSNLKYAAVSGGKFPGDYAGLSATATRVTLAWCVSAKPPNPAAAFHQTLYAAVLGP